MGTGTYSTTSNNIKLVHWSLMGGLLHLVQRGDWAESGGWVSATVFQGRIARIALPLPFPPLPFPPLLSLSLLFPGAPPPLPARESGGAL